MNPQTSDGSVNYNKLEGSVSYKKLEEKSDKKLRSLLDSLSSNHRMISNRIGDIENKVRQITVPYNNETPCSGEPMVVYSPQSISEELEELLTNNQYLATRLDEIYYHLNDFI